jgi:hypothetical protein
MIESKFNAIALQELRTYILQMMILRIFLFLKSLLYLVNETCQISPNFSEVSTRLLKNIGYDL